MEGIIIQLKNFSSCAIQVTEIFDKKFLFYLFHLLKNK